MAGGGEIVSIFLNNTMVDEIIVFVHPVVLGNGIPLFKGIKKQVKLELTGSFEFKEGLVKLHYTVL